MYYDKVGGSNGCRYGRRTGSRSVVRRLKGQVEVVGVTAGGTSAGTLLSVSL